MEGEVLLLVKLQTESATLLKITILRRCLSRFLNCTNDTKSRKASSVQKIQLCQSTSL